MKLFALTSGLFRGLVALSVSLAVIGSSQAFAFAFFSNSNGAQPAQLQSEGGLDSADAFVADGGVRLEWSSKSDPDNLGFNIYRLQNGQRVRINREIIPGSVFAATANDARLSRGNASYGWFDARGTAAAVYYIESVSLAGASQFYPPVTPVAETRTPGRKQTPRYQEAQPETFEIDAEASDNGYREVGYPAISSAAALQQTQQISQQMSAQMSASTIESQWDVAAQPGVKIAVKRDGWYRVTQAQMAAVGFNPAVDIRNLQLFVDGQEVAINTSQSGGLFGASDYIEFFGRGLDIPSTDVRTYYLIAGASPGKRVRGELQIDALPTATPTPQALPTPTASPAAVPNPKPSWSPWRWSKVFSSGLQIDLPSLPLIIRSEPPVSAGGPAPLSQPPAAASSASHNSATPRASTKKRSKRNRKRLRSKTTEPKREYSHAVVAAAAVAPPNFSYTVERKDRGVYFSSLLNGDVENWFGQVISTNPASQTINTPNPAFNAAGPARLEIRLQGVNQFSHQVTVKINDVQVGAFNFFGLANAVQVFDVPLSLLKDSALMNPANNANTVTFTRTAGGVTIVDYARITYPHAFRADADKLKFSLLGTQTVQVDGFTSANVRLIDYTDPTNTSFIKPEMIANGGGGFAMAVPTSAPISKTQRLLYATATPAESPAAITLNQPSTLNRNTNAADFLIITTNSLRTSLAPLVTARQAQMSVAVVDVDDVYDEFGYGVHGPQAVRDFLARANSVWATKPKYVIFAGDASYDPRNYASGGNFDLVPTKLVDATYNETASDDWLADFNDDGIADIPVGRLPVRTPADMDLIVSKIVNFVPPVQQKAMLVADDPTGYYFNFEDSNDEVAQLLPAGMPVQKSYRRLEIKVLTGTTNTNSGSTTVTGSGTLFTTEVQVGNAIAKPDGVRLGTVASIGSNTSLTLTGNALSTYGGSYGKQDNATATARIIAGFNEGRAIVNYSGHGNVDVWTGASIFRSSHALALTNGFDKLPLVVVMDCLNGYFHDPNLLSLSEAFMKAPQGGAVAAFASSGLTLPDGQHYMSQQFYTLLYGAQPIALGDAIKIAKGATVDIDVRRTWIFFGDPSMKIR